MFLEKMLKTNSGDGTVSVVIPQNWQFLPRYTLFRNTLLKNYQWNIVARLGSGAFSWSDTRLVAAALALFAISIVAQGLILLFVRAYYAAGKTRRPLMVNLFSSISSGRSGSTLNVCDLIITSF